MPTMVVVKVAAEAPVVRVIADLLSSVPSLMWPRFLSLSSVAVGAPEIEDGRSLAMTSSRSVGDVKEIPKNELHSPHPANTAIAAWFSGGPRIPVGQDLHRHSFFSVMPQTVCSCACDISLTLLSLIVEEIWSWLLGFMASLQHARELEPPTWRVPQRIPEGSPNRRKTNCGEHACTMSRPSRR